MANTKDTHTFEVETEGLDDAVTGMGAFGIATGGASAAMRSLNAAVKVFLASPLGVILAAVAAVLTPLIAAFQTVQKEMDRFRVLGAQIQQVFLVLRDRIVQVGQGMIAAGTAIARFFKGDFKGAAEAAVEANNLLISSFQGVIDEIVEEVEQVGNLERALIDLEKAENDFLVRRAAIRREQAELLIITRDQTRSFAEQFDALERINELESERLRTEIDLQRRRLAQEFGLLDLTEERIQKIIEEGIALEELGLNISNEEDRAKAIEEVVKLLDLETASITRNREILNRFVELSNRFRGQQRKELQGFGCANTTGLFGIA